jgi:hypothetical protein
MSLVGVVDARTDNHHVQYPGAGPPKSPPIHGCIALRIRSKRISGNPELRASLSTLSTSL